MVKNPRKPPVPLTHVADDIVQFQSALWRIHRTHGTFVRRWDQLRDWGPDPTCRFDPHPSPAGEQPHYAVLYAGCDLRTAVMEVFHGRRRIDTRTSAPVCISWTPTRELHLLDLSASASLPVTRKDTCRNWARAIRDEFPQLDGIAVPSAVTGVRSIVLFAPAADSFPTRPAFARLLDSDEMVSLIAHELSGTTFTLL